MPGIKSRVWGLSWTVGFNTNTVSSIWNTGETGDINMGHKIVLYLNGFVIGMSGIQIPLSQTISLPTSPLYRHWLPTNLMSLSHFSLFVYVKQLKKISKQKKQKGRGEMPLSINLNSFRFYCPFVFGIHLEVSVSTAPPFVSKWRGMMIHSWAKINLKTKLAELLVCPIYRLFYVSQFSKLKCWNSCIYLYHCKNGLLLLGSTITVIQVDLGE